MAGGDFLVLIFYSLTFATYTYGVILDNQMDVPEELAKRGFVPQSTFGGKAKYLTILNLV